MNRIGIMGGTFNPVHTGHLIVAQAAYESFELSSVLFIPCASPPHKEARGLISGSHRLAMLKAAIEGDLRFECSDMELRRGETSYSIDTVSELARRNPHAELVFIIGSDMLPELHLWKDVEQLLELCSFGILRRPGFEDLLKSPEALNLPDPWPARLLDSVVKTHMVDISSSDIRYRIAEGMHIRYLVPAAVEMYIAEHCLYGYGS